MSHSASSIPATGVPQVSTPEASRQGSNFWARSQSQRWTELLSPLLPRLIARQLRQTLPPPSCPAYRRHGHRALCSTSRPRQWAVSRRGQSTWAPCPSIHRRGHRCDRDGAWCHLHQGLRLWMPATAISPLGDAAARHKDSSSARQKDSQPLAPPKAIRYVDDQSVEGWARGECGRRAGLNPDDSDGTDSILPANPNGTAPASTVALWLDEPEGSSAASRPGSPVASENDFMNPAA